MNREQNAIPPTIIQVSQDAVRKLMRHGWNVYPKGYSGCYLLSDDLDLGEERVFRLDRIDWRVGV